MGKVGEETVKGNAGRSLMIQANLIDSATTEWGAADEFPICAIAFDRGTEGVRLFLPSPLWLRVWVDVF